MDCSELEALLERFENGSLSSGERYIVEDHLSTCASCRGLTKLAASNIDIPSLEPPYDLTDSILEQTSGPACRRVHEHLCDFVDGRLESSYGDILSLHLDHCTDCAALGASLSELRSTLPQMSEIDPGTDFTFRVLRATSRMFPEPRVNLWIRFRQWWLLLIQRPRFSWEAAYLGTILLVSMLGNPFAAFHDLSLRTVEIYESRSTFSWVSLALPGSLIRSETGILKGAREAVEVLGRRQREISMTANAALEQGALSFRTKVQSDFRAARNLPARALVAVKHAWDKLHSRVSRESRRAS